MADYYHYLESDYHEASASSNPINLKLIFSDEVASPVFTTKKITGAKKGGNGSIQVILIDANTGQKVTTGTLASAKVKIVLVGGNYDGTTKFEKNIVKVWGKKKNLLRGNVYVDLKHGSGTVGEIRIKHDRNHFKKVEFRLGAMVVDNDHYQVKPAVTQPFKVKDRRITPKFLRLLSPTDKVWRLINICKNGAIHKRLEDKNVFTVKDFLNKYYSNTPALQKIYGSRGKKWEATLNHVKTCNVGNVEGANSMSISFDDDCYIPQPWDQNGSYGKEMIMDDNFSIHEVERWDIDELFHDQGSLQFQAYREDEIGGASNMVGYGGEGKSVKAKKRWMKMRTLWFSIVSFSIVSFKCGCAT